MTAVNVNILPKLWIPDLEIMDLMSFETHKILSRLEGEQWVNIWAFPEGCKLSDFRSIIYNLFWAKDWYYDIKQKIIFGQNHLAQKAIKIILLWQACGLIPTTRWCMPWQARSPSFVRWTSMPSRLTFRYIDPVKNNDRHSHWHWHSILDKEFSFLTIPCILSLIFRSANSESVASIIPWTKLFSIMNSFRRIQS